MLRFAGQVLGAAAVCGVIGLGLGWFFADAKPGPDAPSPPATPPVHVVGIARLDDGSTVASVYIGDGVVCAIYTPAKGESQLSCR